MGQALMELLTCYCLYFALWFTDAKDADTRKRKNNQWVDQVMLNLRVKCFYAQIHGVSRSTTVRRTTVEAFDVFGLYILMCTMKSHDITGIESLDATQNISLETCQLQDNAAMARKEMA